MKIAPFRLLGSRRASRNAAKNPGSSSSRAAHAGGLARDDTAFLGLSDHDMSPRARAKLLDLLGEFDRMKGEAERLQVRIGELEALADTDPLADVMNRRAFVRELTKALAFAERHGGAFSVLYIDLKDFKEINDRHGHRVGDAAIVHVCEYLNANVRETDTVSRIGGDEFAVMLPHANEAQAADKAATLVAGLAGAPLIFESVRLTISATIGVYETQRGDDAESVLRHADAAMYAHKRTA